MPQSRAITVKNYVTTGMFYNFAIKAAWFYIGIAACRSEKMRQFREGQQGVFDQLKQKIDPNASYIWMHVSSLGEFEQGRPILERLHRDYPQYKVILSFFSPSGYEVRKEYDRADVVCYLPLDTKANVCRFLDLVKPVKAIFVKYEFWPNYLRELKRRGIDTVVISAIFRPEQVFFRWYGAWYRKILSTFSHIFVQNDESLELLCAIGDYEVSVCGDTRFDRVLEVQRLAKPLPRIERFVAPRNGLKPQVLVVGSSWQKEEEYVARYMEDHRSLRLVVAPHILSEEHLEEVEERLKFLKTVRYTAASDPDLLTADCLIIDCFGVLSTMYRYCDVAVIGGGFISSGIHNVLEAAVYGKPTLFGPGYPKFLEAVELLSEGGSFTFTTYDQFCQKMDLLLCNPQKMELASRLSYQYVHSRAGATDLILDNLKLGV